MITKTQGSRLVDEVYAVLLPRLIQVQVPPGAPLDEKLLADELGVGRQPVRAALSRLEHDGLVDVFPRRGTFASQIRFNDLASITEVRVELEGLAARLAAQRGTPEERAALVELATASDTGRGADPDEAVHDFIYRMARNAHLTGSLRHYFNLTLRMWYLVADRVDAGQYESDEHIRLAEAVLHGDHERAEALMRTHVASYARLIRDA